jgi:glycosyltransferase involved in cell wall biosynthesis
MGIDVTPHRIGLPEASLTRRLRGFAAAISAIRPDWLVTHNWGTIEWSLANLAIGARQIHIEDGFGLDEALRMKRRRIVARRILLQRSEIVVPSMILQNCARKHWRISPRRLHYIPNGIDCTRFTPARTRSPEISPIGTELVVGTVAALRPEKQLSRLLRAFASICRQSHLRLVIVGEGAEKLRLEALVRELGISDRVKFEGDIADPAPFYRAFDVFALTSDTEQMPYTVLEAMASGCAIVATDVGDTRNMVAEENHPLIVDRNDEQIASAFARLANDRNLVRRLGDANRRKATREYDQSLMFARFAELYGLTEDAAPSTPDQQS